MYANIENERPTLTNDSKKITQNQFTKSLTSFHTKKTFSKNTSQQNSTKKQALLKPEKTSKNKRVYLSR